MANKLTHIEVLSVNGPTFVKTARGGYNTLEVAYKNLSFNGKVEGKKLVDFNNPQVFAEAKALQPGSKVTITQEKGDDDKFWNWTGIGVGSDAPQTEASTGGNTGSGGESAPVPTESSSRAGSKGGRVVGNNYETPEERARRQVYIVRQSSFTAAQEFLAKPAELKEVFEVAEKIEEWVLRGYDVKADGKFSHPEIPL